MGLPTPNVLIVETDARETEHAMELIRDVVRANVDSTNSGERALELASRTNYQLIVADCGTGDMDGLTVLERVKRVSPTTSVILTAGYATIDEAVKAMRIGADEYFKKPVNPEQFKLAVRRAMDRRSLFTGDQAVSGLMLLLNACQLVSGYIEEEKILETVMGYLRRETNCKGIALFRIKGEVRSRIPTSSDIDPDVVEVIVEGHGFIAAAREERVPMKTIPKSNGTPEIVVFQFTCAGDAQYFVVSIAPTWSTPHEEVDSRFRLLQAQIQMTGKNIQNYRGVKHLLYIDEPTGLYNTRYLHVCLDQQIQKCKKDGKGTFSVFFLDVDKFKNINDKYGHLVGTKLLQEIGAILKRCIRRNDFGFRYGGDEFVALLDGIDTPMACLMAEKVRSEVEKTRFLSREAINIRLTVSIGVANFPEHALTKKDVIEAADEAMYSVKRTSRNRVYLAEKKAA